MNMYNRIPISKTTTVSGFFSTVVSPNWCSKVSVFSSSVAGSSVSTSSAAPSVASSESSFEPHAANTNDPHFIFEEWDDYYMNELIISIHPDITFLDKGVKK